MSDRPWRMSLLAAVAVMAVGCLVHVAPRATAALLAVAAAALVGRLAGVQHSVERRRRRATPRTIDGVCVHVEPAVAGASTAGPLRPVVFVGAATLAVLSPAERRAVLLHEQAHRRRWDPLRAALWSLVPDGGARARHVARREIRADKTALRQGASRRALAGALLHVPDARAVDVGFTPPSEARVRALLDPSAETPRHAVAPVLGLVLGLAACWTTGHVLVTRLL